MDQTEKTDIEAAPQYTSYDDDHATLNEEKKDVPHAVKAGDVLRNSGMDGDEALKALEMEEGETIVIDDEMNRKLIRKIGISSRRSHLTYRLAYNALALYYLRTAIS